MKIERKLMSCTQPNPVFPAQLHAQLLNLVACQQSTATVKQTGKKLSNPTNEETTMHTYNHEETARKALNSAVWEARNKHRNAARKHFHITDDEAPETGEEMVKRIKEGNYTLLSEDARGRYDCPWHHFKWRHPDHKADEAGWRDTQAKMDDAMNSLALDIAVDPVPEAKKKVREFESKTFH